MSEADTDITQLALFAAVVASDWEPLWKGVVRIIERVGGKTDPGLLIVNECWERGVVEVGLMPPNSTTILPRERAHRSIHAPSINPAEGVRVEPYEAGEWFIRRAPDFVAPTSAVELSSSAEPKHPALAPSSLQVKSESPSAPKKRSRKKRSRTKTTGGGTQRRRAAAVLNRIFPEDKYHDGYPDEDEMAWLDVWIRFCEEYPRYARDHPSKFGRPSQSTVKRVMGRAE